MAGQSVEETHARVQVEAYFLRLCQASFLFGWNLIECMHMIDTLFQDKYRVESTRLRDWDYAGDGYYFVTICVDDRRECLGKVVEGKMDFSHLGEIAWECWNQIPMHFPIVVLDEFVVMPNHIHGIIRIDNDGADIMCPEEDASIVLPADDVPENGVRTNVETQNFASLPLDDRPLAKQCPGNPPLITESDKPPKAVKSVVADETGKTGEMDKGVNKFGPQSQNLASIVRGFKIGVRVWAKNNDYADFHWQERYYDRIVRNQEALDKICHYIRTNPENWEKGQ